MTITLTGSIKTERRPDGGKLHTNSMGPANGRATNNRICGVNPLLRNITGSKGFDVDEGSITASRGLSWDRVKNSGQTQMRTITHNPKPCGQPHSFRSPGAPA